MRADATDDASFELVECSATAERNWLSRAATGPPYGPVAAWNESIPLPDGHGLECEDARWHPPTETVLLVDDRLDEGRTIVTTMAVDQLKDAARAAVDEARRKYLPR